MQPEPLAKQISAASGSVQADSRAWRQFFFTAVAICLADQASKFWTIVTLTDACDRAGPAPSLAAKIGRFWLAHHPIAVTEQAVFSSWWHFRYVENPGAAWGLLSRGEWAWRTPFFAAIAILAMLFLLQYFRQTNSKQRALRFGLAIVFGGAVGNFIDRMRLGYVIDFIDWHLASGWHWPTFNIADAAITCGVALLLLDVSSPGRTAQAPSSPA